jgi:HEAT repeat protein
MPRDGRVDVVGGCIAILRGATVDDTLVRALAGLAAESVLGGREGGRDGYWPRVWAARGLLYVWDPAASSAIIGAVDDDSWRVREMALKVIARHAVGDGLEAVVRLHADPVARVRQAAIRAAEKIVGHLA